MEVVVNIAIGLLSAIFMASFVALLIICRRNKCGKADFTAHRLKDGKSLRGVELTGARTCPHTEGTPEAGQCWSDELTDIFLDPDWDGDAEALVSNCVKLLKACHRLTESLVVYTMANTALKISKHTVEEIVATAKDIGLKVDNLFEVMHTPSDSEQIEKKCSALYEAVSSLRKIVKEHSDEPAVLGGADDVLRNITELVQAMRTQKEPGLSASSQQQTMSFANRAFCG